MSTSRETGGQDKRERIGDYILSGEIGRGSFATVYKGYRSTTRTPIAIKAVARQKLTPKLLENLEGEINILKTISHPHIVELDDCIKNDHHIYLIMAFCSGGDLSVYIKKRGRLPTLDYRPYPGAELMFWPHPKEGGLDDRVARCFLGQLAEALEFLRERNLIHRDLKPQNLLLQPPTEAQYAAGHPLGIPILKVADFGFARFLPSTDLASTLCGSPLYMAPEILRYEKYDAKADLWSVGAVLYEMMVGRPPFRAQNHVELLRKIEKGEDRIKFPDESSSRSRTDGEHDKIEEPGGPSVAADVKELIRRLLKRVPVQRMSFEDFFACKVWEGYMKTPGYQDQPSSTASSDVTAIATTATRNSPGLSEKPRVTQPHRGQRNRPSPRKPSEPKYFVSNMESNSTLGDDNNGSQTPASFSQNLNRGDASTMPREVAETIARAGPFRPKSVSDDATIGRTSRGATPLQSADDSDRTDTNQATSTNVTDTNEYVLVEKRTVEVNALADELEAAAKRPTGLVRRRSSRTSALGRPMSALAISSGGAAPPSPSSYSPPFSLSTTPPFGLAQQNTLRPASLQAMTSSPSLNARSRPILVPQPNQRSGAAGFSYQHAIQDGRPSGSPGSLQSHGLARAISSASLRWFGSSPVNVLSRFSGRPWVRVRALKRGTEDAAAEDELLDYLEDIARKATVLFEFADSKLAQCVTALRSSAALGGLPAVIATDMSPANIPTDNPRARRRSSSGSTSSTDLTAARLEVLCAEGLVLYLKALAFLQHGVERARKFWEDSAAANTGLSSSPDFNETVQWFRRHFNDCFEKAEWAKSKCAEDMPDSASYVEKLIYDKAIELSRAAAINELVGEELAVSENGYETALWLLYAVLDSILHDGQVVGDADRAMIEKVVVSIQIRLSALYEKTSAFARQESTSQPI